MSTIIQSVGLDIYFAPLMVPYTLLNLTQTISSTNGSTARPILRYVIFFIMLYLNCRIHEAEIVFGDLRGCLSGHRSYHDTEIITKLNKVKRKWEHQQRYENFPKLGRNKLTYQNALKTEVSALSLWGDIISLWWDEGCLTLANVVCICSISHWYHSTKRALWEQEEEEVE